MTVRTELSIHQDSVCQAAVGRRTVGDIELDIPEELLEEVRLFSETRQPTVVA